jgi:UDP-N-acetylmuramoyl-tripeptide--D-alanyl-D-alanine ligase
MSFWTPEQIKAACAGSWLARPTGAEKPAEASAAGGAGSLAQAVVGGAGELSGGLSIDSRKVRPGQIFLALRGETHDGHDHLAQAVAAGAAMLIVHDSEAVARAGVGPGVFVLKVGDTRRALGRLAAAYRQSLTGTKVIAVVGSNGKTTTTRLIQAVLAGKLRGTASEKSFNNDIGVPLTILSAKAGDQFLICEVGSNAPGEIAGLADIVRPDLAVIVSIGREHLAGFGTLAGVAAEEAAILRGLRPGGVCIATADSPELDEHLRGAAGVNVVTFGRSARADLRLSACEHAGAEAGPEAAGLRFEVNRRWTFTLPLVGEHNALNALAAIGVGRRMGLSDEDIAAGLAGARGPEMRLERLEIAGVWVMNDAYNANPDSTLAALRTFAAVAARAGRRVVVLGDNLELGEAAEESHREIGRAVAALGCVDVLITVGPLARLIGEEARQAGGGATPPGRVIAWPDLEGPRPAEAAALLRPGDGVLLKGSRRMALERIVRAMREAATRNPASDALPAV